MENERHYFLVGIFVIGGALAICMFTLWLTSRDDSQYRAYRIKFAESVSGLSNGSDVKFRGVKVGSVQDIRIDPDDSRLIRVDIALLKTTPVKADTKANLKLQGITGIVFVELSGGNPAAADLVQNREDIPEIPAEQSSLNALIDRVPILLDKVAAAVDRINRLVSDENLAHANSMFQNADIAMGDLRQVIGQSGENVTTGSHAAASAMQHLDNTAIRVDALSERIESDPLTFFFPPAEEGVPAP